MLCAEDGRPKDKLALAYEFCHRGSEWPHKKLFSFHQVLLQITVLCKVIYRMPQTGQGASVQGVTGDPIQGSEHCVLRT